MSRVGCRTRIAVSVPGFVAFSPSFALFPSVFLHRPRTLIPVTHHFRYVPGLFIFLSSPYGSPPELNPVEQCWNQMKNVAMASGKLEKRIIIVYNGVSLKI